MLRLGICDYRRFGLVALPSWLLNLLHRFLSARCNQNKTLFLLLTALAGFFLHSSLVAAPRLTAFCLPPKTCWFVRCVCLHRRQSGVCGIANLVRSARSAFTCQYKLCLHFACKVELIRHRLLSHTDAGARPIYTRCDLHMVCTVFCNRKLSASWNLHCRRGALDAIN